MITTHVLDTTHGRPAQGVEVHLFKMVDGKWEFLAGGVTDNNGRIPPLVAELEAAVYKLVFKTGDYFAQHNTIGFYPYIPIIFDIATPNTHYHVPLLLSPYSYSTYRGS
jgi:5-hydroxyisourate hydrolase